MTNPIWKVLSILGAVGLVVAVWALYVATPAQIKDSVAPSGAVGFRLAENYDPYIRYNNGFRTALPIVSSSTLQISGAMTLFSTFQLGASGTAQSNQIVTTCSMKADNSIAASSTGYAYCTGVTGITSADIIQSQFSTSTRQATSQDLVGFVILSALASSTAGNVDFIIANYSGKTQAPSAASRIGSTTDIWAAH